MEYTTIPLRDSSTMSNAFDPSEVIYCPQCENACSRMATCCPRCGHPFVAPASTAMQLAPVGYSPVIIQNQRRSALGTAWRVTCFVLMGALLLYVGMCVWFTGAALERGLSAPNRSNATVSPLQPAATAQPPNDIRLTVLKASVEQSNNEFIASPTLLLQVRNDTPSPIKTVQMRIKVTSEGRTIPWYDDENSFTPSGGLEPGETTDWRIRPNMFSAWRNVPNGRDDLRVEVFPLTLFGADESPIRREPG